MLAKITVEKVTLEQLKSLESMFDFNEDEYGDIIDLNIDLDLNETLLPLILEKLLEFKGKLTITKE